jgi:hypothetical protein
MNKRIAILVAGEKGLTVSLEIEILGWSEKLVARGIIYFY